MRKIRARRAVVLAMVTVLTVSGGPALAVDNSSIIPKKFLLYENETARKAFEKTVGRMSWQFSDRRNALPLIDPCATGKQTDKGREAVRTITGRSVLWDGDYAEQIIIYRDETAARAAVDGLRAQLRRCGERNRRHFTYTTKRVQIGDEAFLVNGLLVSSAMTGTVMRQGRAMAVYTLPNHRRDWRESAYGGAQARKMAVKLAGLTGGTRTR